MPYYFPCFVFLYLDIYKMSCSTGCLLSLKQRSPEGSGSGSGSSKEHWHNKAFLFNVKEKLLGSNPYQCIFGKIDLIAIAHNNNTVDVEIKRCCDLIGTSILLSKLAGNDLLRIETYLGDDEMLDSADTSDLALRASILYDNNDQGSAEESYHQLNALAPFQTNALVFPSTRSSVLKLKLSYTSAVDEKDIEQIKLFGYNYFVNQEHRKSLFIESHVLALTSVTKLSHRSSSSSSSPSFSSFSNTISIPTHICTCSKIAIRLYDLSNSNKQPKDLKIQLGEGAILYDGPMAPLLEETRRRYKGIPTDVLVLDFNDSLFMQSKHQSIVNFKYFKDASVTCQGFAAFDLLFFKLGFLTYSAGTMSYAKMP